MFMVFVTPHVAALTIDALFSYRSRPRRVDHFIEELVAYLHEQKILFKSK